MFTRRNTLIIFLAWLASIGVDFFLHGGLLAKYYLVETDFLLAPLDAFIRIPFGYATFLILTVLLFWLMQHLPTPKLVQGVRVGLIFGALIWGAFALALYSITTAPPELLIAWFVGQTIELGVAGGVIGAGSQGVPLKKIGIWVISGVIFLFLVTVVLQSTGLVPTVKD